MKFDLGAGQYEYSNRYISTEAVILLTENDVIDLSSWAEIIKN